MTTALVSIAADRFERADASANWHANAEFVAHLIATVVSAPQTRERRRAEPEAALAVYQALGHWPTEPGRTVSRSL